MTLSIHPAWRTPLMTLSGLAVMLILTNLIGQFTSARNLADIDLSGRPDVVISLGFTPERFHLEKFQDVGRYQGWADGRAVILSSDPQELRQLARNYWIERIETYEAAR
ncbi:hypothetical protein [Lentilitoribacter sp. Alg239-R112]|jgi:hypothetical protein|uniref:hypothetical protein n=1 Tax=Lentilitoribacter sp. Alg239-R112 TaxID=2305987 RepID=UPI0013A6BBF0|nr:hypothetical protein [Lentilitoribacter sp. Alg239-R112]